MPEVPSRHASVTPSCPICADPLPPGRARTYCSDRCRQTGHRRRHRTDPPAAVALPAVGPSRRERTVYACPDCDQRYLGQQWCTDCTRPCRRIDLGGLCPNCEEPVTVTDLMEAPIG